MTEKELSKYEKEPMFNDLDYIPEYKSHDAPNCEWCNEILDLSEAQTDIDGRLYIECYNCSYLNYLDD